MDTETWYDSDKNPYILFTITVSPLDEDMQKALDYIQYPEKHGISVPERLRILNVSHEPYWEDPKIQIIVSMSSDLETIIPAIKQIEADLQNKE
jgi:hypothetical protein